MTLICEDAKLLKQTFYSLGERKYLLVFISLELHHIVDHICGDVVREVDKPESEMATYFLDGCVVTQGARQVKIKSTCAYRPSFSIF